jgi:hypothetical protein
MRKTGTDHFHIGLGISYPDIYKEEIEEYVSVKLTSEEIDEHKKFYSTAYAKVHKGKKWDERDWKEKSNQYFAPRKTLPYIESAASQEIKYLAVR